MANTNRRKTTMSETAEYPEDVKELRPLELHYFRIPRERWELMLARLRQMGANAVSTVVPWSWHELRDSVFDLTGITHPSRDLVDFLDTCAVMNFRVVLGVGPCVGAGLLASGIPAWLTREHPEMQALGPDSQPRHDLVSGGPLPSAEQPAYLKYVKRWYRELADTVLTRQWPDGPIVALRVDRPGLREAEPQADEIPAHWDYNPHVTEVQWPIWLRQQYDGIDALNAAWGTDYRSFSNAAFPSQSPAGDSSPNFADAARFVAYTAAHAIETYTHMLREMGWTVSIPTTPGNLPGDEAVELAHAVQVDPELPEIGAAVRWAMGAPLRADGYPQPRFWTIKATLLGMKKGVKQIEGSTLVTGTESRKVRLPRPADGYALYRLLLDGSLLDASVQIRGDKLHLDYLAADDAGETDMFILLNDPTAPLTGLLREYLASLLVGRAQTLRRAGAMCKVLAEVLAGAEPPASDEAPPAVGDLRAAERGLAEARLAAQRAATSLGRLERLAAGIRGERPALHPSLLDLSAFTSQELDRLSQVHDACAQAASPLMEAAHSITAFCQEGESTITVQTYRAALQAAQAAVVEIGASSDSHGGLAGALRSLRADLAAGALSSAAWPIHDWLTHILQGLAAGLLRIGE
jgi:hypothetical protein